MRMRVIRSIGWATVLSVGLLLMSVGLENGAAAASSNDPSAALSNRLAPLLGPRDAVAVEAADGTLLVSVNSERLLIPASILKILTGLAAFHYMGEDYRFPTDFFIGPQNSLIIKGYGDPLLVSERLEEIAGRLAERVERVQNLTLDDTYFSHPIIIPGRKSSTQPYDAPNGALCVNFNTVFFKRVKGKWVSAEPQTPLVPFAISKIESSGLKSDRITLAADRTEILRYSGELFDFFLNKAGIAVEGQIKIGTIDRETDRLVWRYRSPSQLTEVVADLLEFSNNFIANQLMLAMGAQAYGSPATVEKGLRALKTYSADMLGIEKGRIEEASGISRGNRISAVEMLRILKRFQPHHRLMRQKGRQWYKTGHLKGVRTRAGYLNSSQGGSYRFVVMLNTPGRGTGHIMRMLERGLK